MTDEGFSADELAAGQRLFGETWFFLKGVVGLEHLPGTDRPEIAFAGRSNVGKSSLINALVGVHGLARASNTPGRTQELNYFLPEGQALYAVDLPGYGFAKAPKAKVEAWTSLIKDYLRGRPNLARVMLLVDSRHGIKTVDKEIMTLLDEAAVTYQIVLTKADKINELKIAAVLRETEAALKKHAAAFPIVLVTSVETNAGIPDLRATIAGIAKENARIR
jgi:GTP-binding protein